MMKRCPQCKADLPAAAFHRQASAKDGLQSKCKRCQTEQNATWRQANADYVAQRRALNYQANRERDRSADRAWRAANAEHLARWTDEYRASGRSRAAVLRNRYRLTAEAYDSLLGAQAGACAICHDPPNGRRLAVDHDHACCPGRQSCGGCIRGLLCGPCNTRLGWLEKRFGEVMGYLAQFHDVNDAVLAGHGDRIRELVFGKEES